MNKMTAGGPRKWLIVSIGFLFLSIVLTAGSCDTPQTQTEASQVDTQQQIYQKVQPVHQYDYSPERDALQQIYDARMADKNTWTVIYSQGKPIWVCPSLGYPIPYTTQLTNPSQETSPGSTANAVIPQAEPNGLYTGTTNATWIRCVRTLPGGGSEIVPIYSEPDAIAFPYPVKIGDSGTVQDLGQDSSIQIKAKK